MNLCFKELSAMLENNKIRPTLHRISILGYLLKNPCHPTVEKIYRELQPEIPTLSRTTVYNTLDLLVKAGLVKELLIVENETRYDPKTEIHGHFKCVECGFISNFDVAIDKVKTGELAGYFITDKNVYFRGICPQCLANIDNKPREE